MVVISWSDHRGNRRGTEFSNGTPPKISKPCHRDTVVGAERSIPLRGTRTFCEGPAELQPHMYENRRWDEIHRMKFCENLE